MLICERSERFFLESLIYFRPVRCNMAKKSEGGISNEELSRYLLKVQRTHNMMFGVGVVGSKLRMEICNLPLNFSTTAKAIAEGYGKWSVSYDMDTSLVDVSPSVENEILGSSN